MALNDMGSTVQRSFNKRMVARAWYRAACQCCAVGAILHGSPARGQVLTEPPTVDISSSGDEAAKTGGFSVKKEDAKIIEQFEDFERYRDKKAWEKAFK